MKKSIQINFALKRKLIVFVCLLAAAGGASYIGWQTRAQNVPAAPPIILYGNDRLTNRLYSFDAAAPGTFLSNVQITGLNQGEQLLGIDLRPANLQFYGLATNGTTSRLLLINSGTGVATPVGSGFASPQIPTNAFCGLAYQVRDDKLRLTCFRGGAGLMNGLLDPNSGIVVSTDTPLGFVPGDPHAGANPLVDEIAFTLATSGSSSITLFGIDDGTGTFVRIGGIDGQPPASTGQLTTIGQLNIGALNQSSDMVANPNDPTKVFAGFNNRLYSINVQTGQGTLVGNFPAGSQIDGLALAPPTNVPANPFIATQGDPGSVTGRTFSAEGTLRSIFLASGLGTGGGNYTLAVSDFNADGSPDLVVGSGRGDSRVKVLSGADSSAVLRDFQAFPGFTGGVSVAVGDVSGDGVPDIIVAAGPGGAPQVKVFDGVTGNVLNSFFAYNANFTGGVFVAAADVNGDGKADIITGAGPGGAPEVKVFNGTNLAVINDFNAYSATFAGGVFVAGGDVNGDGFADIVTGAGPGGGPQVIVFNGRNLNVLQSYFAYNVGFTGGVRVSAGDVNNDRKADIVTSPGPGPGPLSPVPSWLYPSAPDADAQVRIFSGANGSQIGSFLAYDSSYQGGIFVGVIGTPTASLPSPTPTPTPTPTATPTPTPPPFVTVDGKVLTSDGRGLRNTVVSIADPQGVTQTATTSSFGFFSFTNIATGRTYTFRVNSRLFRFAPQSVLVNDNLTLPDFVGLE